MGRALTFFKSLRGRWLVPALVFVSWLVVGCAVIYRAQGSLRPQTHLTPDEMANRVAAQALRKTGRPFIPLPFPDPEDVAHPRAFLSFTDTTAIPVYAPVSIYAYGACALFKNFGYFLVMAWAASGLAAFAAGAALLVGERRAWLGLLAPALGAPALYWMLRPWMNISALLACLGWALAAWAIWRVRGGTAWLALALLWVGAAAAVRPDYTAYVLSIAALFTLAAEPGAYKAVLGFTFLAGALALVANLILNHLITGHAFRAAYQLAIESEEGTASGSRALGFVKALLFPMGLPRLHELQLLFLRYWLELEPLAALLAAQLSLVPLLRARSPRARLLLLGGVVLATLFMCSRMDPDLFGASRGKAALHDSIPRYWTPVYLFAGLSPLLLAAELRRPLFFWLATVFVVGLASASVVAVAVRMERDRDLARGYGHLLTTVSEQAPANAVIYSYDADKALALSFSVGDAENPAKAVRSMRRALEHGLPTYLYLSPAHAHNMSEFLRAAEQQHLSLARSGRHRLLYQLTPTEDASAAAH